MKKAYRLPQKNDAKVLKKNEINNIMGKNLIILMVFAQINTLKPSLNHPHQQQWR